MKIDVDEPLRGDWRQRLRQFYRTSEPYAAHLVAEGREYFRRYLSLIERYSRPGGRVLDAGCGTGLSSSLLSQQGREVIGIDLSELFLNQGRKGGADGALLFAAADVLDLPFQNETFDVVASYLVVEFLPDVPRGLVEMIRVLKRGGILLIVTPNLLSPKWALQDLIRMVFGGKGRPVWCEDLRSAWATFWRNLFLSVKKSFSANPEFLYREPDLSCEKVVGSDSDSVYLASPVDLARFLRKRRFQVLRRSGCETFFERFFPSWSVAVEVVAKKS